MNINYWDCEHSEANEWNYGSEEEPDYIWEYYCNHPDSPDRHCNLDNKWCDAKDECSLLDGERNENI